VAALAVPASTLAAINAVSIGAQTPTPVAAGSSATYTVTVTTDSNRRTQVTSVAGLPAGAGFTSSCVQSNASGSTSITLTITTTAGTTPVGTSTITPTITAYNSSSNCFGTVNATHNTTTAQLAVVKPGTTTTITSHNPNPSSAGGAYPVNVSVTRAVNAGAISGTVTVSDGTDSCTDTTASGSGATATYSCNLTSATPGIKTLTASYAGSTVYAASSGTATHTVDVVDGTGTMTAHTAVIGTGTYSVFPITPGLEFELVDFNFTATTAFPNGSQLTLVIPAGWTPPTLTAGVHGALRINNSECNDPDDGTSDLAISGSGPWTVTVDLQCDAGDEFSLRYANGGGVHVFAPTTAGTYAFTTSTSTNGGTLTPIASQPTLTVVAADQAITFPTLTGVRFDEAAPVPAATASSGLAVSYSTTSTACSVTSDGTITLLGAGECEILADQAGNSNWNAAPQVSRSFTIGLGDQSITFPDPDDAAFPADSVELDASASSGLAVTFTSSTPLVCEVSGTTVTVLHAGTCTIDADQAGNADWNAAPQVSQSFTVDQGAQSITIDPIDDATYGDDPVTVSGTAGSGLELTFSSTTPLVCSVDGTTVTILAAGTCTVQAEQAGDDDWDPATPETVSFTVDKADPDISVTGFTGLYDGNAHGATGTATGVNGEDLSGDLDLGASFTDAPGGTASWTFTDTTGNYNDASGSVEIKISSAPVAVDDDADGTEDEDLDIDIADLLANDTDADDDTLTVTDVDGETGGSVSLDGDTITFDPDKNLCGDNVAGFDYTVSDGEATDTGHVTIDLDCVNDDPKAVDDVATVAEDSGAADHDVLDNDTDADGDELTLESVSIDPSEGTVSIHDNEVRYTPAADFNGTATITYVVTDGTADATGELVVTVTPVDDGDLVPPAVDGVSFTLGKGRIDRTAPLRISWTGSDDDSGIESYEVQLSVNGGGFEPLYEGPATSVVANVRFNRTLVVRVRATDGGANVSDWFVSASRTVAAFQNGNKHVEYKGRWRQAGEPRSSGAGHAYTVEKGASVTLVFRGGKELLYVAPKYATGGKVDVFVDGAKVGRFDLHARATKFGKIISRQAWSTFGRHTVKIVAVNANARTFFDTFIVLK
jgi:hypothetical protein